MLLLSGETANTNVIVFTLTRSGLEPMLSFSWSCKDPIATMHLAGVGLFAVNLCVSHQYLLYFAIMVDYPNFKATASAV
jgi:hypothetical protein